MAEAPELSLIVRHRRFDDDDPRWRSQVSALLDDLRKETGALERRRTPVPGTKGSAEALVLALGSAGVVNASVQIIRAWLERDRHRSVELTFTDADGNPRCVTASAENAGRDVLAPIIAAAARTMAPEE